MDWVGRGGGGGGFWGCGGAARAFPAPDTASASWCHLWLGTSRRNVKCRGSLPTVPHNTPQLSSRTCVIWPLSFGGGRGGIVTVIVCA